MLNENICFQLVTTGPILSKIMKDYQIFWFQINVIARQLKQMHK